MKLEEQLYHIERLDREAMTADLRLLGDCLIYKAHFPEKPITPGVCVIQTAEEILGKLLGMRLTLEEAVNVKFLNVIDPTEHDRIRVSVKKCEPSGDPGGEKRIKASVEVGDGDTVFAKLSMRYICDQ